MSIFVRESGHDVRSMIVVRRGHVIFPWYAHGVTRDHNHNVYSVTKSVVSTLVGIAIDRGHIENADVSLEQFFPQAKSLSEIALGDLLTMRSGLPVSRGNQPRGPQRELFNAVHRAPDRLAQIQKLRLIGRPGEKFQYGNIEPQVALAAVEKAARQDAKRFANESLFNPLKFANQQWQFPDRTGRVPGGYGLRLRAIDMARLGQLYLQGGEWNGNQLVSKSWIREAARDHTGTGYGYYWWTGSRVAGHPSFAARGVRGQLIQIVPELELVFVVTANLPSADVRPVLTKLVDEHLAAAVAKVQALPAAPGDYKELQAELERARSYRPMITNKTSLNRPRLLIPADPTR